MNCSLSIFQAPFSPEFLAPIPQPGLEGNLTMILPAARSCLLMTGVALHRSIHQTAGCLNRLQMQGHCWLSGTLLQNKRREMPETTKEEPFSRSHGPQPCSRFLEAGLSQAALESRSTFTWLPLTRLIGFNWNDFPSRQDSGTVFTRCVTSSGSPPWKPLQPPRPRPFLAFTFLARAARLRMH